MTTDTRKRSIIALRAMFKNAKSMNDFDKVRYLCQINKAKYFVLCDMADHTFERAMEFNQVEDFYI